MNRQSPLYDALQSRGAGKSLSPDFIDGAMSRINAVDRRRRRMRLLWAAVGLCAGSAAVIAFLVLCCGGIIAGLIRDTAESMSDAAGAWQIVAMMLPALVLLLAADAFIRRIYLKRLSGI